ncbi:hypothetical protein [Pseudomonas sp. OV226]|jgi:hypothetical protein|uniref:hypothetical protein n=1 Tax=Pseudomonas sp. OV226 TaxID=2135588 RepID=UPI000D6B1B2B|nr:hypothetical protein [Pseudomonas sp. OV226]PWK29717.1 hypothetical protein C7534_13410 [Pseudomonas sp. OV226]
MSKEDFSASYKVLLLYGALSEADTQFFMATLHTYLLASPRARRTLLQVWQRELNRLLESSPEKASCKLKSPVS